MMPQWRQWLLKLVAGHGKKKAKTRKSFHPTLEVCEERTLLSSATHFAIVGLPNPIPVGTAVTFTVEALDANNHIDTGYDGTTHLTSTDPKAVLPASTPLLSGVGTFSATLETLGGQTLTITGPTGDGLPNFVLDPQSGLGTGYSTGTLSGGYFNNNGILDLVGTGFYDYNGGPLIPYLNNGSGFFTAEPQVNLNTYVPFVVTGDFTANGNGDVAYPNGNSVGVLLGNGNGTFGSPSAYPIPNGAGAMAVGDFTGDGLQDLAVVNGNTLSILFANPNGFYGTTLGSPTNYPLGDEPNDVQVGAFTQNNNLDLVVSNSGDNDVEVFLGNGNGTFGPGVTYAAGSSPSQMAVGDFTGNGIQDIAVDNSSANTVTVLLGNGNGTFGGPISVPAGYNPVGIAAADFTGNGKDDLIVVDTSSSTLFLLLSNGNGSFANAPSISIPGFGGYRLIVGNINGTGLPSVAGIAGNSDGFAYLNTPLTSSTAVTVGAGPATHFTVAAPSSAAEGRPMAITVSGYDQFNDIATSYTGTLQFTSSDTAASFPANATLTNGVGLFSVTFATRGNQTITVSDSVLSSLSGSSASILVSGPATHFTVQAAAGLTAGSSLSVTVTAFDSSNNIATGYTGTLVFTSSDSQAVLPANAALTTGVGTFSVTLKTAGRQTLTATDLATSTLTGASAPIAVSAATLTHLSLSIPTGITAGAAFGLTVTAQDQFNNTATSFTGAVVLSSSDRQAVLPANSTLTSGVGIFTVALKSAGSQTISLTGAGGGTLVPATGSPINVGSGMVTLAVGDFNGDGRLDVAAASDISGTLKILVGNGDGTFQIGPSYTVGFNDQGMVTGDFNGDGKLDLAATVYDSGIFEVVLGNGNGTFGPPVSYPVGINPCALVAGDFNHDGKLDLAVANLGSNTVSVLLGNGDGTFRPAVNYAVGSTPTRLTVGDLNGDGNQDLVVSDQGGTTVSVLLGKADGTFAPAANFAAGASPFGVAVGDFNGDGKQDLAVTDFGGAAVSVLLGNGNGTFGPLTSIAVGSGPDFVVVADLNGDGKPDLVVANRQSNTVTLLFGNGNGTFFTAQTLAVNSSPRQVAVADLNGDGAPDLVVANEQNNGVDIFLNQAVTTTTTVSVIPAAASHFTISAPNQASAGGVVRVTVTALDPFNNTATGYIGTVHFSSSDSTAVLPAGGTLVSGVGAFSLTLLTQGNQTLTVADSLSSTVTGTSAAITVSGAATHFSVISGSTATASSSISVTVTALDSLGNIALGYSGTVHFASSDSQAALPANAPLTAGVGTFTLTLDTAGSQTLTAADAVVGSITGSSSPIVVSPGPVAHFALSGILANATAGAPITFTVLAQDRFNNIATGYTGTVHFASSDSQAALPANAPLTGGTGSFTATLKTAGTETLAASDAVTTTVTGVSMPIAVAPATASHFSVGAPGTEVAGNPFVFTVTALDPFNNIATSYTGIVHFSSSDSQAMLPPDTPLSNGIGYFGAALRTVAKDTLIATDSLTSTITGSTPVTINSAPVSHFGVSAPATTQSGNPLVFTVTAFDPFNNLVTSYAGTVTFSSSDNQAILSSGGKLSNGVGLFAAFLYTPGPQTLTATDSSVPANVGISNAVVVGGAPTAPPHFVLVTPQTVTAGNAFLMEVTAEDQFNNCMTGYSGTVSFLSSDHLALLPGSVMLTSGTGYFAPTLKTAGNQSLSVDGSLGGTMAGTTMNLTVDPAAATHFAVIPALPTYPGVTSGPASFASTGLPTSFTVMALDSFNNPVPTYAGTVQFSSSDTAAGVVLPPSTILSGGAGIFSATLQTAGNQTLTTSDASNAISGTSSPFPTRGEVVTGVTPTPSGFTITFNKPFNPGTVLTYTTGAIPDDILLATANSQVSVRGSVVFNSTDTSLTFVKTASISATGGFNPASGLLAAGNYTVTLRSLTGGNGFADALGVPLDGSNSGHAGNFVFTFAVSAPPVAVGVPDFARGPSNTDALFLPPTLTNGSTFALSYTNPAASPMTGTATVTFSTNAATLQSYIQSALTSGLAAQIGVNASAGGTPNAVAIVTNDTSTGANVLVTFQSALAQATGQLLSSTTAGVTVGLASINVANNIPGSGIPIALSSGLNVTSGSFTLQYNPSLLTITGVVSKIAGASFTLVSNDAVNGMAVLSLSSPSALSGVAAPITLGSLLATVPLSATGSYGTKQLLHFSSAQLAGTAGPIAVTSTAAVQVLAYFGDVADTGGPLGLEDVTALAAVAGGVPNVQAQTLPGFAAFPNLDPAIIGDIVLQGTINPTDAGAINQQVAGIPRPTIPYAPIGLPVTPTGPDPTLSVANIVDEGQTTVIVPVNIDTANPSGSTGMVDASLALVYDPTLWDVSAADVHLGTVPLSGSGWQLSAQVNPQSGLIGIEIDSLTTIQSAAGGSLVTITMHPRAGAPGGETGLALVPYVDPSGGMRVFQTQLSDGQGAFVLHWSAAPAAQTVDSPQIAVGGAKPAVSDDSVVKQTSEASGMAPAVRDLSPADMERAFEEFAEVGVSGSWPTANSWPDPALLQLSKAWTPSEGLTDDWLASQCQAATLAAMEPTTDVLEESGPPAEEQKTGRSSTGRFWEEIFFSNPSPDSDFWKTSKFS